MKKILLILLFIYNLSYSNDLILKNNLLYEKNKKVPYTGKGVYSIWVNNEKYGEYTGELKQGNFIGKGTYFSFYEGNYEGKVVVDYKNGFSFLGYGVEYNKYDTIIYEGNFKEGSYSGKGTRYYWDESNIYRGKTIGDFEKGFVNGYATKYYSDNSIEYDGEMKNGEYNGNGTYYWSSLDKIAGIWENGKLRITDENTKKNYFKSPEDLYIENFIQIYDTEIARSEEVCNIRIKIKNKGSRTIGELQLLIEYKDVEGKVIYEKLITPITSLNNYNQVQYLDPNNIYQMAKGMYFKDYMVPSEWNGDYIISVKYLSLNSR